MVTGRWDFRIPLRDCPSQNSIMKFHVLVGVLVMVGFAVGKAPVSEVRTCHLCLLEDPSTGCISGSEKCTISSSSPCMVITIYYDTKIRFFIRGCGQYNSYRCQEKRNTYFSEYWYQAQCCQAESKTWRPGRSRAQQSWEPRGGAVRWDLSFPQPPPLSEERDELYSLYTNLFGRNTWGLEAREAHGGRRGKARPRSS
ncbi:lymphocyte antigen 6 complex locus protein G5b isoform X3 [Panthera leo]|uniref:lymphocyte antigen 6 complex locus protein G5b isoform X3 n=1 Tax=Panthera leo TaxID=9689 RepID=UPI001C69EDA9|nr:lymphocyte antigen 6 complex locus protein G5b isoform X3 [Panthera leo]